jgi:signal transduction histidine kinase
MMMDHISNHTEPLPGIQFSQMNLSERELALLNEIGLAATQLLDVEKILNLAVETLVGNFNMAVVMVYLWDPQSERYTLQTWHGVSQEQIDEIEHRRMAGDDITQQVVDTGETVFIQDMSTDRRFDGVWENNVPRSYIKLAMVSRGTVVGVLGLITQRNHLLSNYSVEFLKAIGREIGIAIDNATLLSDTQRREQQALTLYNLGMKISASLSLGSVLESVAEASQELMQADLGLVGLVHSDSQGVVLEAISGRRTNRVPDYSSSSIDPDAWSRLSSGQPVLSSKNNTQPMIRLHDEQFIQEEGVQSFLAVPLMRGDTFLGLIEVMQRKPYRFLPSDITLVQRLAYQVVLSIENAQLYRRLHHMAALEERDRLARALHDDLSQGLGYLKIKTTITDELLTDGKIEKAQESLLELKKVCQMLYTDVREEIFNLRTVVQERFGFFSTLQDYLADYRTHYGLHVDLVIENECLPEFPPQVSGQLLRIIQEALTNVRKHSAAAKVWLRCSQQGEMMCVHIEDDGKGFHLSNGFEENGQHFGLQIMKERAESVGGNLTLESSPGAGTRVIVCVPAEYQDS